MSSATQAALEIALARHALVVTPNKRLAREIVTRHDRAQVEAGRNAWSAARVLPWGVFVGEFVQGAQDAGLALPMRQLDPVQSGLMWQRIAARELAQKPLVDPDAAAALALQAWEHVHAHGGGGGESWRGFGEGNPDVEAFVRWANAFQRETLRLDAIDAARAADALVPIAHALPGIRAIDVVLTGFIELSPQQQRLVQALQAAGARVDMLAMHAPEALAPSARLTGTLGADDELAQAFVWARKIAESAPHARIGIVVPDLAQRRAAVRAIADERLCPALQWAGREAQTRPYDISAGEPLADVPLVAAALDLIVLAHRPLEAHRAAALLRSPWIPGPAEVWAARAALERTWREQGEAALSWPRLVDEVARVDPVLARRWRNAQAGVRWPARAAPRDWVESWRAWLALAGWNEGCSLDSAQFQALRAWNELLATFARLAAVAPQMARDEALAMLVKLAREQLFQPEASGARIHVLGLLEASGLAFDALWVSGMTADAWPQTPQPHPMLPIAWQRERRVPRSHPERELEFARRLTTSLSHAAPEVVFSYAAQGDDHLRAPSPLVAGLARWSGEGVGPTSAQHMFAMRPALDALADPVAPALAVGSSLPGGAGMIEAQSTCPFRAVAQYRLRADEWPTVGVGLTPSERGQLLHAALSAFWNATKTQAALLAMPADELNARIATAIDASRNALKASRWQSLPAAIAAAEAGCLAALLRQWLVEVDGTRPAFSVQATEVRARVQLGGYTFNVTLDRVDALADGARAIIDYKTGRATPPAKWFEERPQGTQLALYSVAQRQREPAIPVRALVYGKLRAGEVEAVGLTDVDATWPGLDLPQALRNAGLADWAMALSQLETGVDALAAACGAGDAQVAPRAPVVCTTCHLKALCRIGATLADDDVEVEAESE